jgi:cell division protein FtsB
MERMPARAIKNLTKGIVRPEPLAQRISSNRGVRWTVGLATSTVGLAILLGVVVLPVSDWFVQNSAVAKRSAELEALADANEQLQNEINELKTPDGTRNAARDQLGYVMPGEQRVSLLPMPALPADLPDTWPYTLVESIVAVRTVENVPADRALQPLVP